MTPELMQFMGALLAVAGVWWRVEGMIRKNTDDLAAHRLEVAQSYVTKAGLSEQTNQLIKAIDAVSSKIDHMNGRIDGIFTAKPTAARPRTT